MNLRSTFHTSLFIHGLSDLNCRLWRPDVQRGAEITQTAEFITPEKSRALQKLRYPSDLLCRRLGSLHGRTHKKLLHDLVRGSVNSGELAIVKFRSPIFTRGLLMILSLADLCF